MFFPTFVQNVMEMKQKTPLELGLKLLADRKIVRHNEYRFIGPNFGFVNSFIHMETNLLKIGQPYRIKEGRIAFVKQGMARISINLIEYTFEAYTLSVITPNSIIEIIEYSSDLDMQMMAITEDFVLLQRREELLNYFLPGNQSILIHLTDKERIQTEYFFNTLWNILQEPIFRQEVIQHLLVALVYNIDYILKDNQHTNNSCLSRQEELFQRFISLVNTYSRTKRNVSFYAEKLCLTPRYLNTVIRKTSQQTVMEWINQAVILEAKVLLKHSNLMIYQIADELNYPNPSFFCKFFKRMTGITPQEYQKLR